MKNILCLLLMVIFSECNAQWSDDFNDGDFSFNPEWIGDEDSFEVTSNQLHLNAPPNTSESYLVTNSSAATDGYWEFSVRLDFNPSGSNMLLIYLLSDTSDLKGPVYGYYVQVGGANDQVNLYKQSGSSSALLIEGTSGLLDANDVNLKLKVSRNTQGLFELFADTSQGFGNYVLQGQATDNTYTNSSYFGFLCDYTSSRSDKFWMDDIVISAQEYVDTDQPVILSHQLDALDELTLIFNEPLDSIWATNPSNSTLSNNIIYRITYENAFLHLKLQQEIRNSFLYNLNLMLKDEIGNLLDTTVQIIIEDNHEFGAVLLNEIYADETPSYGIPNGEFIEIYNQSNDTIQLLEWKIADAKDTAVIPNDTILPHSYIILCKSSVWGPYTAFGKTISVPNFPSLNNTNDQILLLNAYDKVVDSVFYSNAWYRELLDSAGNEKSAGGYSLERVNQLANCANYYNWYPAIHAQGASPGQENSVFNYNFPALDVSISDLLIENDTTLLFTFSDELPNIQTQNCFIAGAPIEQVYQPRFNQLYVLLDKPLEYGRIYQIEISGVLDCYQSAVAKVVYEFYLNEPAVSGDIIFNEILFNPRTGGSDYIELYNSSTKAIDIEGFTLLEYDVFEAHEIIDSIVLKSMVLPPKTYLVLTEDTAHVLYNYIVNDPKYLVSHSIPNLNDDESIVALYLSDGSMSDSLKYHKSWHLELLDIKDGVALERISADGKTNDKTNWYSAAKTYGYGTPTAENSQAYHEVINGKTMVSPEVFTPNEDGYKDFCLIQYQSEGKGELINISIYNLEGKEVRLLAQNHSVGTDNTWRWNGLNNNFEKADIGIYIVLYEIFSAEGKRKSYKEKVVLGTQLN